MGALNVKGRKVKFDETDTYKSLGVVGSGHGGEIYGICRFDPALRFKPDMLARTSPFSLEVDLRRTENLLRDGSYNGYGEGVNLLREVDIPYFNNSQRLYAELIAALKGIPFSSDSIVLTGARGAGKTVVGRELSSLLELPFVDADSEFIERHGSITDFVKSKSWEEFRRLETELIGDICAKYKNKKIVFAPGGGAVAHDQGDQYRDRNVQLLRKFGLVFYLLPSPDMEKSAAILTERIKGDATSTSLRPSLTGDSDPAKEMLSTLKQRTDFYFSAASHITYTGSKKPSEVAKDIAGIYKPGIPKAA